jgi:hypothetical protein
MTNNPNELTLENSALVLIDHQPYIALAVPRVSPAERPEDRKTHVRQLCPPHLKQVADIKGRPPVKYKPKV